MTRRGGAALFVLSLSAQTNEFHESQVRYICIFKPCEIYSELQGLQIALVSVGELKNQKRGEKKTDFEMFVI